jgi:hypothetical protein
MIQGEVDCGSSTTTAVSSIVAGQLGIPRSHCLSAAPGGNLLQPVPAACEALWMLVSLGEREWDRESDDSTAWRWLAWA